MYSIQGAIYTLADSIRYIPIHLPSRSAIISIIVFILMHYPRTFSVLIETFQKYNPSSITNL